ncbi:hypothetical protein [Rhizobium leguminosarum]
MRIGISGHQERDGIDWVWVREEIDAALHRISQPVHGYSSLAAGSDQVFAQALLDSGANVTAVIPTSDYERFFKPEALKIYRQLLAKCQKVELQSAETSEQSFLNAGIFIARHSDLLMAVWDGKPAEGLGGTGDIVKYCSDHSIPVLIINPIQKTVKREMSA